jgi:23S rRNA (guanine745-N1)-methyltransferase
MKQNPFDNLACPLDGLDLVRTENSLRCTNNHNYDFDRKGTINLLPVQFKKSKNPGDSKEMVIARERFLNSRCYEPISDKLNELVAGQFENPVIFDAGCGEGYYTERLASLLSALKTDDAFSIAGMDISKDAIHEASKRSRDIAWLVGTNAKIPVQDSSVNIIASLFGFPVWPEFSRISKPEGVVITVDVGADHLIELRRILYPEIREKETNDFVPEGFEITEQHRLHQVINLPEQASISDLLVMTPHGYRAIKENQEIALQTKFETMTLDVVFKIYCAKNSA